MSAKWCAGIFLVSLCVFVAAGFLLPAAQYMDADYYTAAAVQLAGGRGATTPFIWNYLNDPAGLPEPAFTYWMPLASLLEAAALALGAAQPLSRLPFWLLAAALPPVAAWMGWKLDRSKFAAFGAAGLALLPGYYAPYLIGPDAFAIYMLAGAGLIFLVSEAQPGLDWRWAAAGALCGVMHMARADGLLWLGVLCVLAFWKGIAPKTRSTGKISLSERLLPIGLALAGYLPLAWAWYVRNVQLMGSVFPPGGSRALWLTRYEDTFLYPGNLLTFQRWAASGWNSILQARLEAVWTNLQSLVAVGGSIAAFPFALVGLVARRRNPMILPGLVFWLVVFLAMGLVFPFAGINGSYFHAAAGVQILLWAAAPVGVRTVVEWLARQRKWEKGANVAVFVMALLILTGGFLALLQFGKQPASSGREAAQVEALLKREGATPCLTIMVNNPPGYYLKAQRAAVVIPYGDENMVLAAARRYGVSYLAVGQSNSGHLPGLYQQPGDRPGLKYLGSVEDERVYAIEP